MILKKFYYSMPIYIQNSVQYFVNKLDYTIVDDFIENNYGKEYGLMKKDRIVLINRILEILKNINSASSVQSLTTLLKKVISLPPVSSGVIVECGSFEGASTSVLSIGAKLVDRKLIVYDSFEGLPDVETNEPRYYPHLSVYGYYLKGMYSATEEKVAKNIKLYGEIVNVEFRKGLFEDTLKKHQERIDFIFMDVDLSSSTKTCIKYLWPKLNENSYIFSDDACDMDVVKLWFDKEWWNKNFSIDPPGYIGSGCGLPLTGDFSSLGYSFKNLDYKNYSRVNWLKY